MFALSLRRVVSCVVLFGVLILRGAWAEDPVPAPISVDKDVAAYLTLPNLKNLATTVDGIAKQIMPPEEYQQFQAKMAPALADPNVAPLLGKPILAVLFKIPQGFNPDAGAPPPMAGFIPVNADSPMLDKVKEAMKDNPVAQASYEDGMLIVASAGALDRAKAVKSLYGKVADANLQTDARLYISISSLMDTFGSMLKGQLAQGEQMALDGLKRDPPPPDLGLSPELCAQVVRVFFKAVNGFLDQCDGIQLDIKVKSDSIQVDELFAAKPGTLLADFLSGNPPTPNSNLMSFMTKGFIVNYTALDTKAFGSAWKKAMGEISADPQTAPLAQNELLQLVGQSFEAMGGEVVYAVTPGAAGPEIVEAFTLADSAKYQAVMQRAWGYFGPDSIFSKIYAQMGMKFDMKYEKGVRNHAGVSIDRVNMSMDNPRAPKEVADKLKQFMPQPEVALLKDMGLMASNTATMDAMIDKTAKGDFTPSGVTMKSMTTFGKGKNMYFDYDLVGYMKFVMTKMAPDPNAGAMFNQLKSNDPMLMSYAYSSGRAMVQVNIPLAPIIEMTKLFQAIAGGAGLAPPKQPETNKNTF